MKSFNLNSLKEGILWCLFFILTFLVGYYHGKSPETQLSYHYSDVKNIDVLTTDDRLLSSMFLEYIEKETHTKIRVIKKPRYEDFRTELIINKNIALILAPENFVKPLVKDNRIRNFEVLKGDIDKQIHFDFNPKPLADNKIYSLPVIWFINVFSVNKEKPLVFDLFDNIYLWNIKKINPKWNITSKVKIEQRSLIEPIAIKDFTEVTLQQAEQKKIKYQFDSAWSQLVVFSFIIPNTAPDKDLSFKILRLFLTDTKARQLFQRPEFGYTSNELNGDDLTLFNSPEALRNLNFNLFNPNYNQFDEKLWR